MRSRRTKKVLILGSAPSARLWVNKFLPLGWIENFYEVVAINNAWALLKGTGIKQTWYHPREFTEKIPQNTEKLGTLFPDDHDMEFITDRSYIQTDMRPHRTKQFNKTTMTITCCYRILNRYHKGGVHIALVGCDADYSGKYDRTGSTYFYGIGMSIKQCK